MTILVIAAAFLLISAPSFALLLIGILVLFDVLMVILKAVRLNNSEPFEYPLAIRFLKIPVGNTQP